MSRPVRMCVGCRERGPRSALLRVVLADTKPVLVVDRAARLPGRGAWVHPEAACVDQAIRRGGFGRGLRCKQAIDTSAIVAEVTDRP